MVARTRIALLSTSDTDLLSARASGAGYVWANPARSTAAELTALVGGADLVVVRLLGSPHELWPGLSTVREDGTPLVILGGEQRPNAELMELSTVPMGRPPKRTATWPRAVRPTLPSCTPSSPTRCC